MSRAMVTKAYIKKACYGCGKPIVKGQSYLYFHSRGGAASYCSLCLRNFADQVDIKNGEHDPRTRENNSIPS